MISQKCANCHCGGWCEYDFETDQVYPYQPDECPETGGQTQMMTIAEYQEKAARTFRAELTSSQMFYHALHGMCSELGEINGILQKQYQGHEVNAAHMKSELGDLMWFVTEFCVANGWTLEEVCAENNAKLLNRYPNGFEEKRSLYRAEGDI